MVKHTCPLDYVNYVDCPVKRQLQSCTFPLTILETNQSDHSYSVRVQVGSKQGPRSRLLGRSSQSRIMSAASRIAVCLKSVDFEVFGKVQGKYPEIIMLVV